MTIVSEFTKKQKHTSIILKNNENHLILSKNNINSSRFVTD